MREQVNVDADATRYLNSGRPVAIWGASRLGEYCYKHLKVLGVDVCFFIDSDKSKEGKSLLGLDIASPEYFLSTFASTPVVIASQYWNEITRELFHTNKIGEVAIFSMPPECKSPSLLWIERDPAKKQSYDLCFFQSNFSGSNSYALYKYIKSMYPELKVTLINRNNLTSSAIAHARCSTLHIVTHEHDFLDDTPSVQTYHGFPLKGIGAMSKYQNNKSMMRTRDTWQKHKKIFSYSNLYTSLISACFGGFTEQYEVTGMPRNDYLGSGSLAKQKLKRIFPQIDGFQMIGFYAPTFRETKFSQVNGIPSYGFLPTQDPEVIEDFCEKNRIALIKKAHPYEVAHTTYDSQVFLSCTDQDFQEQGLDLYECLAGFDFLLTDFSSIFFDFLLLNKPIGFLAYDLAKYSENRGFLLENYDAWSPGPKLRKDSELIDFLNSLLASVDEYKNERLKVSSMVHRFNDFQSTARCAESCHGLLHELAP